MCVCGFLLLLEFFVCFLFLCCGFLVGLGFVCLISVRFSSSLFFSFPFFLFFFFFFFFLFVCVCVCLCVCVSACLFTF